MAVIHLEKPKPRRMHKPRRAPQVHAAKRGGRSQALAAAGVMLVALALLGLSLSHLASGVAIVTGSSEPDGWLMAIGIDLGFVALELAMLIAPAAARPAMPHLPSSAP